MADAACCRGLLTRSQFADPPRSELSHGEPNGRATFPETVAGLLFAGRTEGGVVLRVAGLFFLVFLLPLSVHAEGRVALLIGNQGYSSKIGPLKNPQNDIALIGAALEKVGFTVTLVKDAG